MSKELENQKLNYVTQGDYSFGTIQRTTYNDCSEALFTVIPTFTAKVVVCSSACFGTDKKVPFLL